MHDKYDMSIVQMWHYDIHIDHIGCVWALQEISLANIISASLILIWKQRGLRYPYALEFLILLVRCVVPVRVAVVFVVA